MRGEAKNPGTAFDAVLLLGYIEARIIACSVDIALR
jgi:hypothetical protein